MQVLPQIRMGKPQSPDQRSVVGARSHRPLPPRVSKPDSVLRLRMRSVWQSSLLSLGLALGVSGGALALPLHSSPSEPAPPQTATTQPVLQASPSQPVPPVSVPPGAIQPSPPPTAPPTETYRLGPGDRLLVDIFAVPEHSGERQVLIDGAVHLNWVGGVPVQGLTLAEAAQAITAAYDRHLYDPVVTLTLISPRPLRVSLAGAVNRPGTYVVPFTETPGGTPDARWPTVTQALQLAGGIAQFANVRQVQVSRQQAGAATETFYLDLWTLLQSGDLGQDIALRDGDSIWVPTAADIDPAEAQRLASASFSPATIRVNVVGEVPRPGTVEVPPNTPLNQALLAAGGFDNSRAETGAVQLVRLNADGSVSQRSVAVDFTQGINDDTNPILYANDVVIVGRSGGAQFSDSFNGVLETLGKIFPLFLLF